MDPERWRQIERLYQAALERKPSERDKFIAKACEGETELCRDVRSLLAQGTRTESFIEKPAIESAAPVLIEDCDLEGHGPQSARSKIRPPWWMFLAATPFLAHMVFMWALWLIGPEPIGIEVRGTGSHPVIAKVAQGSPAERAGIRPGDFVVHANGRPVTNMNVWFWFATNVEPDKPVTLDTDRTGQHFRAVLVLQRAGAKDWFSAEGMLRLVGLCAQLIALATACFMAFLRPRDLLACIGALVLAVYSAAIMDPYDGLNSMFRNSPLWFQVLLWAAIGVTGLGLGVWFTFFALFPRPSFHNRWIWAIVWTPNVLVSAVLSYQIWLFVHGPEHMIPSDWMSLMYAACWITYLPVPSRCLS
jgi:hypothetical protein